MARRITWDDKELAAKLNGTDARLRAFVYSACAYHARQGQRYARRNAPWTDRTGNARNGLFGKAFRDGKQSRTSTTFAMVIYGTVTYQPFLEVRWSGKYAIIRPTIQHEGPELMKTIGQAYAAVFGGGSLPRTG